LSKELQLWQFSSSLHYSDVDLIEQNMFAEFVHARFMKIWISTVNQGQVVSDCSNPFNRCIETSLPGMLLSKLIQDFFDENAETVPHGLQLKLSQFLGHFATCILLH
jgi:hypothetical protein